MTENTIFDVISKNPVSIIRNFDPEFDLVEKYNATVFYVQYSDIDTLTMYQKNLKKEYGVGYALEKNKKFTKKDKLVFCSSEFIKNFLLDLVERKTSCYDFCSVLVLDNFDFDKIVNNILINLWVKIYKSSNIRPYLVLLTYNQFVPDIPLDFSKNNTLDLTIKNKKTIFYNEKTYSLEDNNLNDGMIIKIKEFHDKFPPEKDTGSTWIIFCSQKNSRKKIFQKLYCLFGKENNIFSLYKDSKHTNILNIIKNSKKGKRNFVVTEESINVPRCIENIDGVFDCMTTNFKYKEEETNAYISKTTAENHIKYLKDGFCFRMCEESFYEKLPLVDFSEILRTDLSKYYLDLINRNIDPFEIFSYNISKKNIEDTLDYLCELLVISKKEDKIYQITETGKFSLKTPCNIKNCILLNNWLEKEKPLFPVLLLISIIETNQPVFYGKNINEKYKSTDTLTSILKVFLDIIQKFKKINLTDNEIKVYCKENDLNYITVDSVFSKIRNISNNLEEEKDLDISIFDINEFLKELVIFCEKIYFKETFRVINRSKSLYSNGMDEICSLDSFKFRNPELKEPSKLITLIFTNVKKDKDPKKNKKLISLFITVN